MGLHNVGFRIMPLQITINELVFAGKPCFFRGNLQITHPISVILIVRFRKNTQSFMIELRGSQLIHVLLVAHLIRHRSSTGFLFHRFFFLLGSIGNRPLLSCGPCCPVFGFSPPRVLLRTLLLLHGVNRSNLICQRLCCYRAAQQ